MRPKTDECCRTMPWVNVEEFVRTEPPSEREKRQVFERIARKAKARFYADENFPVLATEYLRRCRADVVTVQELALTGHPDENHAATALRMGRVLITCDHDYLDDKKFPLVHCPAIVICDLGSATPAEIKATFTCLGTIFAAPYFFDKWTKIHAKQDCWTEHIRFLDGTTLRRRYRFHRGKLQEWAVS